MQTKSIILTSFGLKNINMNKFFDEEDFILIFGDQEFRMNSIFAEFISPVISRLHKSDPTIQSFKFDDLFLDKAKYFAKFSESILSKDTTTLFKQISSGYSIEIDDNQAFKLRFLSVILGNEELFKKINELFPPDFSVQNVSTYLEFVQSCYYYSQFSPDFDFSGVIDFISSNFYSIDPETFLKIPRYIQYLIISNPNLQIKTEDSLLDIVLKIIESTTFSEHADQDDQIDNSLFLENIEFALLSENKLREFLSNFDFNQITNSLWRKFYECFFIHFEWKADRIEGRRSNQKTYQYVQNITNPFEGIFYHFQEKFGGNVDIKEICKITSSTVFEEYIPSNVTEFDSNHLIFSSLNVKNSWLKFNFIGRKIQPTFYSIKTCKSVKGKKGDNLKSWVIEGSNNDRDWVVLDERNNNSTLNSDLIVNIFKIQNLQNSMNISSI